MPRIVGTIGIVFGVCFATYASGEVFRCTDASGKVEFRDRPCEGKAVAEKLDVKPNSVALDLTIPQSLLLRADEVIQ